MELCWPPPPSAPASGSLKLLRAPQARPRSTTDPMGRSRLIARHRSPAGGAATRLAISGAASSEADRPVNPSIALLDSRELGECRLAHGRVGLRRLGRCPHASAPSFTQAVPIASLLERKASTTAISAGSNKSQRGKRFLIARRGLRWRAYRGVGLGCHLWRSCAERTTEWQTASSMPIARSSRRAAPLRSSPAQGNGGEVTGDQAWPRTHALEWRLDAQRAVAADDCCHWPGQTLGCDCRQVLSR